MSATTCAHLPEWWEYRQGEIVVTGPLEESRTLGVVWCVGCDTDVAWLPGDQERRDKVGALMNSLDRRLR